MATGTSIVFMIITLIITMIAIAGVGAHYVSSAVIFMKANDKPWKSLIPFYNNYTYFKLAWNTKMFIPFLVTRVGFIIGIILLGVSAYESRMYYPNNAEILELVGQIVSWVFFIGNIVFSILLWIRVSKAFGKTGGFTVGLVLLNLVFRMMLAFGDSEYKSGTDNNMQEHKEPKKKPHQLNYEPGMIKCVAGDVKGARKEIIAGAKIIIGRDPTSADFIVDKNNPSSKISRTHCAIEYEPAKNIYFVTDLSSNGTMLGDGTKLIKGVRTPVKRDSIIVLSNTAQFIVL